MGLTSFVAKIKAIVFGGKKAKESKTVQNIEETKELNFAPQKKVLLDTTLQELKTVQNIEETKELNFAHQKKVILYATLQELNELENQEITDLQEEILWEYDHLGIDESHEYYDYHRYYILDLLDDFDEDDIVDEFDFDDEFDLEIQFEEYKLLNLCDAYYESNECYELEEYYKYGKYDEDEEAHLIFEMFKTYDWYKSYAYYNENIIYEYECFYRYYNSYKYCEWNVLQEFKHWIELEDLNEAERLNEDNKWDKRDEWDIEYEMFELQKLSELNGWDEIIEELDEIGISSSEKEIEDMISKVDLDGFNFVDEVKRTSNLECFIPSKIFHYGIYYPYRDGENQNFDEFSSNIISLKNGGFISYFSQLLSNYIKGNWWEFQCITSICVIPSHDPSNNSSPTHKLAKELLNQFKWQDTSHCLVRKIKIDKLSQSGNRSIYVHEKSIIVINRKLIENQSILLLDDVTTTGNSMAACEKILLQSNASNVIKLAIAKTY